MKLEEMMAQPRHCPAESEQPEWKTNGQEQLGIVPLGYHCIKMEEQVWVSKGYFKEKGII